MDKPTIKRYRPRLKKQDGHVYVRMEPDPVGDYSRHSDYEAVAKLAADLVGIVKDYRGRRPHICCIAGAYEGSILDDRCQGCQSADTLLEIAKKAGIE